MSGPRYRNRTLAAQALGVADPATNAVIPSIQPSTTFHRTPGGPVAPYSRFESPTGQLPEAVLTQLEAGAAAALYSSGVSAATSVFLALEPGDHVVAQSKMYWGLKRWLENDGRRLGLRVDFADPEDPEDLARKVEPGVTKLVWIETPVNPTWVIVDIARAAEIAHAAGARLGIDATVSSPVLTRPIEHGADIVMHSATKYLNGHSDVLAGALITAREDDLWARVMHNRVQLGCVLAPFDSWLLLRSMRTLHVRVTTQSATALALAERLSEDPRVAQVLYPGLPGHPGHDIAARQMQGGFGGMLSIRLRGGGEAASRAAQRTRLFHNATSLGGVESLTEWRYAVEGEQGSAPPDLLRLSVGLEDPEDLWEDIDQALSEGD